MEVECYISVLWWLVLSSVTIVSFAQADDCRDTLPNCNTYAASSCKAPYTGWAYTNCRKRCNLCNNPNLRGTCRDEIPNCQDHIHLNNVCVSSTYKWWASQKCKRSCGLCPAAEIGALKSASIDPLKPLAHERKPFSKTNPSTTFVKQKTCEDKIPSCHLYPESACQVAGWALNSCRKRCNLCGEQPSTCEDKLPNCNQMGVHIICTGYYVDWAQQYCPKTCQFCGVTALPNIQLPKFTLHPMSLYVKSLFPPTCEDKRSYCNTYPDDFCTSADNKMFSIPYCQKRCNFCGDVSETCVDKTDCSQMGFSIFCNGYFRNWAKQNCPVTCNFCTQKPYATEPKVITITGPNTENGNSRILKKRDVKGERMSCKQDGKTYHHGETWLQNCENRCTCKASEDKYQISCKGICWTWQLPLSVGCYMNPPAPGKCCATPHCPSGVSLQYPNGYKEE